MSKSNRNSVEDAIQTAYAALMAYDKEPPPAEAVAKLAGLPIEVVKKWFRNQGDGQIAYALSD